MKKYHGRCHCGKVTFTVDGNFTEGISCNCSHCKRKGSLLAFVPKNQFQLLTGSDALQTYKFNKKMIAHKFCQTCGVQSFAESGETIAINLNCIEDGDLDTSSLIIKKVDGKNF